MLLYPDESYKIMGACFKVYTEMGNGFLESVYQECLELEFSKRKIPVVSQQSLPVMYCGTPLKQYYIADFVCYEKIIVEIKAIAHLKDEHRSQVLNYLNTTGLKLGLLVNFGHYPKVESERIALSHNKSKNDSYKINLTAKDLFQSSED
jgi:GxxExxY protein